MRLKNNKNDISYLAKLVPVEALFYLGCFTSDLASSLRQIPHKGQITAVDETTGYITWNIRGVDMNKVCIDIVELL